MSTSDEDISTPLYAFFGVCAASSETPAPRPTRTLGDQSNARKSAKMTAVAIHLGATELGGSAVLIWVPAATIVAVYWSVLRTARGPDSTSSVPAAAGEPRHDRDRIPTA